MHFENTLGLYLLAFIIPLIIVYMIKAKPKELKVPSLIFFSEEKKAKKYSSILRKLLILLLFFLQLLFILLIAFSAANPIVQIPMDAYSINTIAIIDTSASMNTKDGADARMDAGKEDFLKKIKGQVSIILAEENPVVLAKNISASRAKAIIQNLEAKEVPTRLDSSILFANDLLGPERGNIIVYSDFLTDKTDDILSVKKIVEANDKRLILVQAGKKQPNLGFITLNLERGKGEAFIKNYGDMSKTVDVRFLSSKKDSIRLSIEPNSMERVTFEVPQGETILQLSEADKMGVDDRIFIYNPFNAKSKILLITNNEKKNQILNALRANPNFDVAVTVPPVIPDLKFDLVIVSDVDKKLLLPNTLRDLKRFKDNGGKVIIASQQDINLLEFGNLIDFKFGDISTAEDTICVDVVNQLTKGLSNPKCFTSTNKYYNAAKAKNSSVVLASTSKGVPIFIMEENLFYYGIIDSNSGFKDQINYPLFWDGLAQYLLGLEDIHNFNFKTGDLLVQGNNSEKIILDKAGIYSYGDRRVAVNLINEQESNIYRDSILVNQTDLETKYEKVNLDVNIDYILLALAGLLFIYELYYIKKRGDL